VPKRLVVGRHLGAARHEDGHARRELCSGRRRGGSTAAAAALRRASHHARAIRHAEAHGLALHLLGERAYRGEGLGLGGGGAGRKRDRHPGGSGLGQL
jgi:hypothetical protein